MVTKTVERWVQGVLLGGQRLEISSTSYDECSRLGINRALRYPALLHMHLPRDGPLSQPRMLADLATRCNKIEKIYKYEYRNRT